MINIKTAGLYTEEQRKALCKWCKDQGKDKCGSCGIPQTAPKTAGSKLKTRSR